MSAKTDFLPSCLSCSDPCCNGNIIVTVEERRRMLERWKGADPFRYDSRFDYYHLDIEKCPFLNENNMCAVHEVRPTICRLYPFSIIPLKAGGFRLYLDKSCSVSHSISDEEKEELREIARVFLNELGSKRFWAFYESW